MSNVEMVVAPDDTGKDLSGCDYVYLMRHARHDQGTLHLDALVKIRGVGDRLGEWLESRPGDIAVAYSPSPEVIETMMQLVAAASEHPTTANTVEQPAVRFHLGGRNRTPLRPVPLRLGRTKADRPNVWAHRGPEGWLPLPATDEADELAWGDGVRAEEAGSNAVTLGPYDSDEGAIAPIRAWLQGPPDPEGLPARMFIGNDPLVSRLVADLGGNLGLAHGELACLQRSPPSWIRSQVAAKLSWLDEHPPRYRVIWTAAPYDKEELEGIQAKVKSKMTTAGSLGTVITALLVFLLKNEGDGMSWWSWASLTAFVGAAVLYFVTLFFYDTLSMPSRFWASSRNPTLTGASTTTPRVWRRIQRGYSPLRRPPTSTALVLKEAMVHIWSWLFLPATVLTGLGVALLVGDLASHPTQAISWPPQDIAWAGVAYLLALGTFSAAHRPNLGTSD